jgi:3',5'-cyclic AMP phosphodiesterase CpdA
VPRCLGVVVVLLAVACSQAPERREPVFTAAAPPARQVLALPNRSGSIKFAAIGDAGRGDEPQYDVSAQMQAFREVFPYDFVVMLGDNVYDGGTPDDYRRKFELPYKPLLDAGVKFYATLGNHDSTNQPMYPPFHMNGQRYYTFKADRSLLARLTDTDVQFFMIDTETLDQTEQAWIDREMGTSGATWKIPIFHRPIYTSGRYSTPARLFRHVLEPIFLRHGVKVVLSGHEHFYERTTPQNGITYFISGGAGSLRYGDIRPSPLLAKGFDTDYHFMLFEVTADAVYYQAIARTGHSIDSGRVMRTGPPS